MRALALLLAMLLALSFGQAASAHALPGTAVLLDFARSDVAMEIDAPLDQFELGFKHPVMDDPMATVQRYPRLLPAYFLAHVQPVAPDGRPWRVSVESLAIEPADATSPIDVRAKLRLTPPPGAPVRKFRLNYSVINHEVMTHTVLVFAHGDWQTGTFGTEPQLLGTVRWLTTGIDIDRGVGSFWTGFSAIFRLGMQHIAEGTDHLLFLLALLLPAPLLRGEDGRWGGYGGVRHAAIGLGKLITAFTIGHSLTLLLGAVLPVEIPSKPVEIGIALSIFVSALHAWRPLLRGREALVAAGFGLIHGLAFSQVIASGGLDGWHKAAAVLGFNLGIETMQLLVVATVVPWLILLAKAGRYTPVRLAGAAFAAVASLSWFAERVSGMPNPASHALEGLLEAAPFALIALASGALLAMAVPRRVPA